MMDPIASTQNKHIKIEYIIIAGLLALIILLILRLYSKLIKERKHKAFLAAELAWHHKATLVKEINDDLGLNQETYKKQGAYLQLKPTLSFGIKIDTAFPFIIERKGKMVEVRITQFKDGISLGLSNGSETWFTNYDLEDNNQDLTLTKEVVDKINLMLTDSPPFEEPADHEPKS